MGAYINYFGVWNIFLHHTIVYFFFFLIFLMSADMLSHIYEVLYDADPYFCSTCSATGNVHTGFCSCT